MRRAVDHHRIADKDNERTEETGKGAPRACKLNGNEEATQMKMDQVAYYCKSSRAETIVKESLGLLNAPWVTDTVTAKVRMNRSRIEETNVAELQFCYALGTEFEILKYISGPHWLQHIADTCSRPFIAHVGFHLEPGEEWPHLPYFHIVQEVTKTEHTNAELIRLGKTYQYRIHEISPGTYWKFIRRVINGVAQ